MLARKTAENTPFLNRPSILRMPPLPKCHVEAAKSVKNTVFLRGEHFGTKKPPGRKMRLEAPKPAFHKIIGILLFFLFGRGASPDDADSLEKSAQMLRWGSHRSS